MGNPGDSSSVYSLLSIISNPQTAKANLDELTKLSDEVKQGLDAQATKIKDLEARESTLRDDQAQLIIDAKALQDREQALNDLSNKLDSKQFTLDQGFADLQSLKSVLESRTSALDQRQTALSTKEGTLTALQDQLKLAQDKADSLRQEYEAKLMQLKGIVDAPV